jgi:hypothetical protein
LSVLFSAHKCETIFPGTVVQHRWQVLWSWVNYPWRKPVASSSFPLYPLSLRKHRCMFCVKVHLLRHLLVFYKNNCDEGLCSCVGLSRPIMPSNSTCEKKNLSFLPQNVTERRAPKECSQFGEIWKVVRVRY